MSKINCGLINDLLPLYTDEVCSDESRKVVEEHISSCEDCRNELKKMKSHVSLSVDKDTGMLKKIKWHILIGKIVVSLIAGVIVLFASFFILNTDCSMNYEKCNLAKNVWVEEDTDGTLWLVKKGAALSADFIYPTLSDENGRHLGYDDDFDKEKKVGYGVTLKHRKIDALTITEMGLEQEERTLLTNVKERGLTKIFYYDDVNGKEYILWENKN